MIDIVLIIAQLYLLIGATLWALWLHPLDRARDIPLTILTWPHPVACWIASQSRELADIETLRRHSR
jgi:hypothetical protein